MPTDECFRLHDRKDLFPPEELREQYQADASSVVGPSWFDLALHVKCELLTEKEVLGLQSYSRPRTQQRKPTCIFEETKYQGRHTQQG